MKEAERRKATTEIESFKKSQADTKVSSQNEEKNVEIKKLTQDKSIFKLDDAVLSSVLPKGKLS